MLRILNAGAEDGYPGPYVIFNTDTDRCFVDDHGESSFYDMSDIFLEDPTSIRSIQFLEKVSLIWPR